MVTDLWDMITDADRCLVIAEAGVNHNGSLELAKQLVNAAVKADADAVKFQSFQAKHLACTQAPKADYQLQTTLSGETQYEMLQKLEISKQFQNEISEYCHQEDIQFLSTPFDEESADIIDKIGVPVFKISSGEITNLPFLEYIASKNKPMILSTGMSYLSEIDRAVSTIYATGNHRLALMQCVSNYPADPGDVNLRAIRTMAENFNIPVGYSDHTPGIEIALAAVTLGACVVEKHFTLDQTLPGPDHKASLEPVELVAMVAGIRKIERAMGTGRKIPAQSEAENRTVIRRSLAAAVDIPPGAVLKPAMLKSLRPASGLSPVFMDHVNGCRAKRLLKSGEFIAWSDME